MHGGLVTTVLSYCEILISLRSCIQEVCSKAESTALDISGNAYSFGHAHT